MRLAIHAWAATKVLLVLTVLLGIAYPLAMTVVAQAETVQAHGSLIEANGRVVGSRLLGQAASDPRWFQARPSASDYSGDTSGGSNWGPAAPQLAQSVADRERALRTANPNAPGGPIPPDALTASGSGLDPEISPAYAAWQTPRVATSWGVPVSEVQQLVTENTDRAFLGFLGADRVNVTKLNVALAVYGATHSIR